MWTRCALAAVAAGLTFSPVNAQNAQNAQNEKTVLGTLTCTALEGELNRFATSAVALSCEFQAAEGGYAEKYAGTLRRLADEQRIEKPIVLMWTVSGSPEALSPGILEQHYLSSAPADDPKNRQLHGQKNASIILSPHIRNGETTEQTVTVLDLDLKRTRA